MDDQVDALHEKTVEYLGKIGNTSLTEAQTEHFITLLDAVNNLENIGDVIETDLVGLGHKLIDGDLRISDGTYGVLTEIHSAVVRSVDAAIQSVAQGSGTAARHEARLLGARDSKQLAVYAIEVDVIEKLKRIYYFAKRMAKTVRPGVDAEEDA